VETISHLRENGRITILFNAFQGPPRICRLFGTGTVHEFGTLGYDALIPVNERKPGSRSAIIINVHKVGTVSIVYFFRFRSCCYPSLQQSCGYAVPLYIFQSHRTKLLEFFDKKENAERMAPPGGVSDDGLKAYWALKNMKSIDGLEGLSVAHKACTTPQSTFDKVEEMKPQAALVESRRDTGNIKFLAGLSLGIFLSAFYVRLVGAA